MDAPEHLYVDLARAYLRGRCLHVDEDANVEALLSQAKQHGLKLHRFKKTAMLPRVTAVLGALRGMAPESLLDIGSGRGVFLWPLLVAFDEIAVTAVDRDVRRLEHLRAVRDGGVSRLQVIESNAASLPFDDHAFEVVTVLEVLEHQHDPKPLACETVRLARRFVIASVPSKPDENPEHVQLFTGDTLKHLLLDAGAITVNIRYVLNHIIAVASVRSADG